MIRRFTTWVGYAFSTGITNDLILMNPGNDWFLFFEPWVYGVWVELVLRSYCTFGMPAY